MQKLLVHHIIVFCVFVIVIAWIHCVDQKASDMRLVSLQIELFAKKNYYYIVSSNEMCPLDFCSFFPSFRNHRWLDGWDLSFPLRLSTFPAALNLAARSFLSKRWLSKDCSHTTLSFISLYMFLDHALQNVLYAGGWGTIRCIKRMTHNTPKPKGKYVKHNVKLD